MNELRCLDGWNREEDELGHRPRCKDYPSCKAQRRIVAFIQDAPPIKDIMKAQGIPDLQAPQPIPKFVDTLKAIDELSSYDSPPPR